MAETVAFKYRACISCRTMVIAAMAALAACSGAARAAPDVHDGMSKQQLATFAERQGWQADISTMGNDVTIKVGDKSVFVTLTDCNAAGSCLSGLIRDQSYYFIKTPTGTCDFWHWNYEAKGATGFGTKYVTLQRYLNFRGVTDQYLKDSIDAYLAAAPSFWELVEACWKPAVPSP